MNSQKETTRQTCNSETHERGEVCLLEQCQTFLKCFDDL